MERYSVRRRDRPNQGRTLLNLYEKGLVTREIVMMFGISGILPDRSNYRGMSPEEQEAIWAEKMANRFGSDWRVQFERLRLPVIRVNDIKKVNRWLKEGF